MKTTLNPVILTYKTAFMQRISDSVRRGYRRYIQGEIALEKVGAFAAKMDDLYGTSHSPTQSFRLRKSGLATGRLLLWVDQSIERVHWVLLVSDGELRAGGNEQWKNALDVRHAIKLTHYELVQLVKPLEPKPVLTWRYEKKVYEAWRIMLQDFVRKRQDDELKQLIHQLQRSAGFAGVRIQVKKLWQLVKGDWQRNRGKHEVMPEIPTRIGYVGRLESKGKTWKVLMREQSKQV
jgi:hypothetical protein